MINKVVFFNFYHNGDIHISRGFIRKISEICESRGISCEYYHGNDPSLLADIPYVKHTCNNYGLVDTYKSASIEDTLFINTWYLADPENFEKYSSTFDNLYYTFRDSVKFLDIDLETIPAIDLFPSIDFTYFKTSKAKEWIDGHTKKRVFVSNGYALSGQSVNFSFANIINRLARENTNIDFLMTNHELGIAQLPNLHLTSNIIQNNGCDLNENSYIAENCDLIIGRCSGPYSFAMTRETYFEKPKTFLAFTNMPHNLVVWTDKLTPPVKSKFFEFRFYNPEVVFGTINRHLPR
jgi:hypothetical protein